MRRRTGFAIPGDGSIHSCPFEKTELRTYFLRFDSIVSLFRKPCANVFSFNFAPVVHWHNLLEPDRPTSPFRHRRSSHRQRERASDVACFIRRQETRKHSRPLPCSAARNGTACTETDLSILRCPSVPSPCASTRVDRARANAIRAHPFFACSTARRAWSVHPAFRPAIGRILSPAR